MAMGIVSNDDFQNELGKLCPIQSNETKGVIKDIERGRPIGGLEVPNALRKVIGEESAINGRNSALDLAAQFGISPSSVSAYSKGAHSTASYDTRPDISHITTAKLKIASKARNRLVMALNSLTQEKIDSAKVKDVSSVAKDMAAVIRVMEPEKSNSESNGPTFIFYSPHLRQEQNFETIIVKE